MVKILLKLQLFSSQNYATNKTLNKIVGLKFYTEFFVILLEYM